MNKKEIKQIILEEITSVLSEMGPDSELYPDGYDFDDEDVKYVADLLLSDDDDITPPGIEDMSPDPAFGPDPSFVEENLEEGRSSDVFVLSRKADIKQILQFMQRVNNLLKTYKTPGQKRSKKRFTPEQMKALANVMANGGNNADQDKYPNGFTSKDLVDIGIFNQRSQANDFLKKVMSKNLIKIVSQLKKSQEPARDPNAPERRGRPPKPRTSNPDTKFDTPDTEFDTPDDAMDMDMEDFEDLDLSDIDALEEEGVLGFDNEAEFMQVLLDYVKSTGKVGELFQMLKSQGMSEEDIMQILDDNNLTLQENKTTMPNLEKYIRQQIKEAKSPLASKMKEVETRGRIAALETKLAAIDEMIEETQGRLTRIDEDEEFTEMMDKNAVKGVRKQLKELERAKLKLEKEYAKAAGGRKRPKPVVGEDEDIPENPNDPMDHPALPEEVESEEDNFALSESVKRMQKLANLKG